MAGGTINSTGITFPVTKQYVRWKTLMLEVISYRVVSRKDVQT